MVAAIRFDGLRKEFENNIKTVNEAIQKDLEHLEDEIILDALKNYQKKYTSVEHDSKSLMGIFPSGKECGQIISCPFASVACGTHFNHVACRPNGVSDAPSV